MTTARWIRITRPAWFNQAACKNVGPAPFFPERGGHSGGHTTARKLCDTCPVRPSCLAYAIADPSLTGFWAGTTDNDRDRLRTRRAM